jgi:acetyl esterase/lipase
MFMQLKLKWNKSLWSALLVAIVFQSINVAHAQNTNNMDYINRDKESISSRFMKGVFRVVPLKKMIERNAKKDNIKQEAAAIPKKLRKKFTIEESSVSGRKVWKIIPAIPSGKTVVFLHGGAYIFNLGAMHWEFVGDMVARTGDTYLVVDYPLAPNNNIEDALKMLADVFANIQDQKIILMGDSAGAGLALSYALEHKNADERIKALILISPFVNVTMNNENIEAVESKDLILSAKGLIAAGELYRGELAANDPKISPLFGDLSQLPTTTIFMGGCDILMPDAKLLRDKLREAHVTCHYYEYPKMIHDWVVLAQIKEAHGTRSQIADLINGI